MPSQRTFSVLLGLIIAFLLSMAIISYLSLNNFILNAKWISHAALTLKELEGIVSNVKDAQRAHRGYELTSDSSFLEPYNNIKAVIDKRIKVVDSLFMDQGTQRSRLDTVSHLIQRQYNITDEIITRKKEESGLDRYGVSLLTFDEENMDRLRALVDRMRIEEERLLKERTSSQNVVGKITPVAILLSFVSGVISLIYLFTQLYKALKTRSVAENELERNLMQLSQEVNQKELAQESLKKVLDSSTNGVVFLHALREKGKIFDFEYILGNKQIESILNVKLDDVIGNKLLTVFPGKKHTGLYENYVEVVNDGVALDREYYHEAGEKTTWFRVTATKLEDGCVVTFSDITASKQFEQELIIMNQELAESNKNLEEFAYVASHDLQEPLRKVRAFGDRLATKYETVIDDKGRDYIARMNGAAERMQSLIGDLLKYSRVARNPKAMVRVDLERIIENVLLDFETTINQREAEVVIKGLQPIDGDDVQLRQLFQNLISNAIKFTPKETSPVVTITGKKVKGKTQKGEFNISNNKNFLRIEVEDNGIGFDEKYAERIFNIFERLHGKSEFEGTGIGLAICQKVVQNHNGFIKAKSSTSGAKFIILLPVKNSNHGGQQRN